MKRILFVVIGMIFGFAIHAQKIISLEDGSVSAKVASTAPSREVDEVSDGLLVSYEFKKALLQPDPLYGDTHWWKIDGFGFEETLTKPATLARVDQFAIPEGKEATVELINCDYVDYNYILTPAREPLSDDNNQQYTKNNVPPITKSNAWYPANIIDDIDTQIYRGVGVLNVKVSPIQYNSVKGVVRAYTKIVYKIKFSDGIEAYSDGENNEHSISADDPFLQNITLNGYSKSFNRASANSILNSQDYLIISVPKYSSAVNAFAEWKKLLGFNVHVLLRDNWTPATIKNEVQSLYNSNKNLYYLLIIGDHEDVPSNSSSIIRSHVTDLFYGCMDGDNDYTPDIYRGRLSVSNETEAAIVVNKIIAYEKSPITTSSFYTNGVNCAYFQDDNNDGYEDRRFTLTSEDVRTYLISQGKNIQRIYKAASNVTPMHWNNGSYSTGGALPTELLKPAFAWNGNSSDITSAINNGAFYVLHRDHGNTSGWGDPSYTISNLNQLSNGSKLPVVFSMNCQTGKFNGTTCFTETFQRKSSGGCVAIYGASETSYSGYNDVLTGGMFDAIWPSPGLRIVLPRQSSTGITPTPTYRLGQILDQGMNRMSEIYGSSNSYVKYTKELFHCFGDPSMFFPTSTPSSFSNVSCIRGNDRITVSLPSGTATITFYDLVSGEVYSYNGSNAIYMTSHPQNVSVCISGHNKIPYILNGITPVYVQNETISGPKTISGTVVKIGSNVTNTKTQGPVKFNGGTITIEGSEIEIQPNTTITNTTTFKTIIK